MTNEEYFPIRLENLRENIEGAVKQVADAISQDPVKLADIVDDDGSVLRKLTEAMMWLMLARDEFAQIKEALATEKKEAAQ